MSAGRELVRPLSARLGHDFGATAFGVEQIAARRCATVSVLCICSPEFLALDCADIRCPTHGLAAVLRPALEGARE